MGAGFFGSIVSMAGEVQESGGAGDIIVMLLIWVEVYFVSHPLMSLILIGLFQGLISGITRDAIGFLTGIFVGSIANIVFHFVAEIVLNSCDCIFYCFAQEQDRQLTQDRFNHLYDVVKGNVNTGTPAGDTTAVVSGTAVGNTPKEEK